MTTGIWSAASGAVARISELDVAANNIANTTTPGYRADRAIFRQELVRATGTDVGTQSHRYAIVRSVEPDLQPGQIVRSGRPLDVVLREPDHFFVVTTPRGERYTRAGALQLTQDGSVTTSEGLSYVDANRRPVRVPAESQEVSVSANGELVVDGEATGVQLLTVQFSDAKGLTKEGDTLLRMTPNSGRPMTVDPDLEPEAVELSNSSAVKSMTTLVTTTRQFDMITKVIEAFGKAEQLAATQVMRGR